MALRFEDFAVLMPTDWVRYAVATGDYSDFMGDWIYPVKALEKLQNKK